MSSFSEFRAEIDRVSKTFPEEHIVAIQKKVSFEALRRLVEKTPVDTGFARANWLVTVDRESDQVPHESDSPGATPVREAITRGNAVISSGVKTFCVVHIQNNVEYIEALEDGHSAQARDPDGMLAVTFEELKFMFG